MIFWAIVFWVATFLITELLRPKPQFEDARPAGLGEFTFPTATEGRAVPLIWGRVHIRGPNLVWYGNLRQEPITEEVQTGLFSSDEVTTGYRYYIGLQFALCRGPDVTLIEVKVNEKTLYSGPTSASGLIGLVNNTILGGEEFGAGGISGQGWFSQGNDDAAVDPYLAGHQYPGVAYRGTCYVAFHGGWIGNSPSIQPWSFIVERIPDGLGMASYDPGSEVVNGQDCNPMNAIFEIMTNVDWGLKIPVSEIDVPNFQAAGATLAAEGNGFSMVLDRELQASDLLDELRRQIDGVLYYDRGIGQWKVELARDGYDTSSLPVFDESNVTELVEFSRQTWEETTNQVRIRFQDAHDSFKDTYAFAQDMGNNLIQGGPVAAEANYPGVKNATLANSIAWRELRTLTYPLSKMTIHCNREAHALRPGSLFKFSWNRLGINSVVYRVGNIDHGVLTDGKITVFAVEDIFSTGVGVFGDPQGTGWDLPDDDAVPLETENTLVFEAPRQMVVRDVTNPAQNPRVWMGGENPGGGTINFRAFIKKGATRPLGGSFVSDAAINAFLRSGTLDANVAQYAATSVRPDVSSYIDVNVSGTITDLVVSGSPTTVAQLLTLVKINDEFIGFELSADQGGGVLRLSRLWRGLFNSVQQAHSIGDTVWFIGQTGGNLTQAVIAANEDEVDLQLRSQDINGPVDEGDCDTEELTLGLLYRQPLPPRDPVLNGTYADTTAVSLDTQYTSGTGRTGDDARALEVEVTPRAWRIDDVTQDHNLGLSSPTYTADTPELDYDLVLDPGGGDIAVPTVTQDGDDPVAYVLRNEIIKAVGPNANIPGTARLTVTPRHTPSEWGVEYAGVSLVHDMAVVSSIQADDLTFGGLIMNTASAAVVFGETGTYAFDIKTALPSSGILEANVNGGGYATVVSAGNTTGNLSITAGDSVVLRFTQAPAADQFFDITGPTSETGHGVLRA